MQNYNRNKPKFKNFDSNNRKPRFDGPKPGGLQVFLRDGEPIEKALRKFKKKVESAGIMETLRDKQHYTKPSARRREAKKSAVARWKRTKRELEDKQY